MLKKICNTLEETKNNFIDYDLARALKQSILVVRVVSVAG